MSWPYQAGTMCNRNAHVGSRYIVTAQKCPCNQLFFITTRLNKHINETVMIRIFDQSQIRKGTGLVGPRHVVALPGRYHAQPAKITTKIRNSSTPSFHKIMVM